MKNNHVIADFQILPIGVGTSLSPYIAECEKILEEADLNARLHTMGTNLEGDWDEVIGAVKRCHEQLHNKGVKRVVTSLKLSTRVDKDQSIQSRIESVESQK